MKICAAPKRERCVEEDKRNQIFNPSGNVKNKCSRRSDGSLTSNNAATKNLVTLNSKSISLPPSPTITSIQPAGSSNELTTFSCSDNNGLVVNVDSENEKQLLIKIRDELRSSPLLKSILEANLNEN